MKNNPAIVPNLIHECLELSAVLFPEKTALICGEERWTYSGLNNTASMLAQRLAECGIGRGDRVVIFLDNSVECVISIYAVLKAGGVFIVVNSAIKAKKLDYILKDSGAKILIANAGRREVVRDAIGDPAEDILTIWCPEVLDAAAKIPFRSLNWKDLIGSTGPPGSTEDNHRGQECIDFDLASLIYTSGSTGDPKGVVSSHFNVVSAARSIIKYLENTEKDIILSVLPLSFDYGLYQVIMTFMFGGTIVLEKSFMYPVKVMEKIQAERVTGFPIVPTIGALLVRMKNMGDLDLGTLRYLFSTAAALPVEHIRKLKQMFHPAKFFSMYGLTECKRVSYLPPEELDARPNSVGKPIPNCNAMIVDGNGHEVEPGQIGELVVKGANVMRGYWNAPELTAEVFKPGAYPGEVLLYSGDLFRKDEDGFLYFVGRKDDQIKTKGERVSPKEIEDVLCDLEGVAEAAVIGVPDEILGHAIKCFIVRTCEAGITERTVIKHCTDNLEPFMIPKYVEFIPEMPKSAHGKIDKKILKEKSMGPVLPDAK